MNLDWKARRTKEVYQWHRKLRSDLSPSQMVETLKTHRRDADPEDDYDLALLLKSELILSAIESFREAESVIDEMIERMPTDVRFPIAKAQLHLYHTGNLEKALGAIEKAIERAQRHGAFRREALGVKARIFNKLGRYDKLAQTLEEIMSFEPRHGVPDIGRERDFVDAAPAGAIPKDVLGRYNAFRPKRSGD